MYCHAACRGNQVSSALSALMVIPEFFSILDFVGFDLIAYRLHHPFCTSRCSGGCISVIAVG